MAARAAFVIVCLGALVQVRTLRWIGVKVPELGADEREAQLECRFHVEDHEYFKIANWYKDGKLLLSCLPTGVRRRHSVKGVHMTYHGIARIGMCDFKVEDISKKALGEYKCEAIVFYPQNVGVWGSATLSRGKNESTAGDENPLDELTTEFDTGVTDGDSTENHHH